MRMEDDILDCCVEELFRIARHLVSVRRTLSHKCEEKMMRA
jgi:hypothetical protein